MIHHRLAEQLRRPDRGRRVAALAGQKQCLQLRQIVLPQEFSLRVLLLDRAHRGGRGEQHFDPVLRADAPERAGIGRADRLALVHDAGAAAQQRRVDDVAVPDHPADIATPPSRRRRRRRRRSSASSSTAPPRARHCRAPRPSAGRSFPRCKGYTADRLPPPAPDRAAPPSPRPPADRGRGPRSARPAPARAAGSGRRRGLCGDSAIAASSSGL